MNPLRAAVLVNLQIARRYADHPKAAWRSLFKSNRKLDEKHQKNDGKEKLLHRAFTFRCFYLSPCFRSARWLAGGVQGLCRDVSRRGNGSVREPSRRAEISCSKLRSSAGCIGASSSRGSILTRARSQSSQAGRPSHTQINTHLIRVATIGRFRRIRLRPPFQHPWLWRSDGRT
jgi:hypothetical protein